MTQANRSGWAGRFKTTAVVVVAHFQRGQLAAMASSNVKDLGQLSSQHRAASQGEVGRPAAGQGEAPRQKGRTNQRPVQSRPWASMASSHDSLRWSSAMRTDRRSRNKNARKDYCWDSGAFAANPQRTCGHDECIGLAGQWHCRPRRTTGRACQSARGEFATIRRCRFLIQLLVDFLHSRLMCGRFSSSSRQIANCLSVSGLLR